MTKVRVKVEIPDGYELACQWMRAAKIGEWYVDDPWSVTECGIVSVENRVIVRLAWQWPEWLKAPWIAMDKNGKYYGYSSEPSIVGNGNMWLCEADTAADLQSWALDWTPPPCDDWTESKRENPNRIEQ